MYLVQCEQRVFQYRLETLLRYPKSPLTKLLLKVGPARIVTLDYDASIMAYIVGYQKRQVSRGTLRDLSRHGRAQLLQYSADLKLYDLYDDLCSIKSKSSENRENFKSIISLAAQVLSSLSPNCKWMFDLIHKECLRYLDKTATDEDDLYELGSRRRHRSTRRRRSSSSRSKSESRSRSSSPSSSSSSTSSSSSSPSRSRSSSPSSRSGSSRKSASRSGSTGSASSSTTEPQQERQGRGDKHRRPNPNPNPSRKRNHRKDFEGGHDDTGTSPTEGDTLPAESERSYLDSGASSGLDASFMPPMSHAPHMPHVGGVSSIAGMHGMHGISGLGGGLAPSQQPSMGGVADMFARMGPRISAAVNMNRGQGGNPCATMSCGKPCSSGVCMVPPGCMAPSAGSMPSSGCMPFVQGRPVSSGPVCGMTGNGSTPVPTFATSMGPMSRGAGVFRGPNVAIRTPHSGMGFADSKRRGAEPDLGSGMGLGDSFPGDKKTPGPSSTSASTSFLPPELMQMFMKAAMGLANAKPPHTGGETKDTKAPSGPTSSPAPAPSANEGKDIKESKDGKDSSTTTATASHGETVIPVQVSESRGGAVSIPVTTGETDGSQHSI